MKFIGVLDGVRAVSVIIVLIFHFWQQTWIFPTVNTPFLQFIGISRIDFTPFAKVGYLFVDMMILISGMLLFLPVAMNVFIGEPLSKWRTYYKKRAIRILPSYLLCVIALFVYELIMGGYGKPIVFSEAAADLISHLFFVHTWKVQTYLMTKLNVVLWTLAVEVWFYVLFPLFASFVRRWKKERSFLGSLIRSLILGVAMIGVSFVYIYGYALVPESAFAGTVDGILLKLGSGIRSTYPAMVINQLPAFMGTYAVGMFGSLLYVFAASKLKRRWYVSLPSTILCLAFGYLIVQMVKQCSVCDPAAAQVWQLTARLPLALAFMGFILTAAFSARWFGFIFSNRLMRFLSGISYNLYIWHQWLCVQMKNVWRIPAWEGDTPPNMWVGADYTPAQQAAGMEWRTKYAVLITVFAFAAAILATYLIERPAADLLNGRPSVYNGKLGLLIKQRREKKPKR